MIRDIPNALRESLLQIPGVLRVGAEELPGNQVAITCYLREADEGLRGQANMPDTLADDVDNVSGITAWMAVIVSWAEKHNNT